MIRLLCAGGEGAVGNADREGVDGGDLGRAADRVHEREPVALEALHDEAFAAEETGTEPTLPAAPTGWQFNAPVFPPGTRSR